MAFRKTSILQGKGARYFLSLHIVDHSGLPCETACLHCIISYNVIIIVEAKSNQTSCVLNYLEITLKHTRTLINFYEVCCQVLWDQGFR